MGTSFHSTVRTFTFKGKILVFLVKSLYLVAGLFMKMRHRRPVREHHEDPARMSLRESLYLGSKYYLHAPVEAENEKVKEYFLHQNYDLKAPDGFITKHTMRLSAGGDLMPYRMINKEICSKLWEHCGAFYFDADLVFANLETPLVPERPVSAVPEVMLNHMLFNANEEMFDIFSGCGKFKGFDVLSVINNHSLDQGEEGFVRTLDYLEGKNIKTCGGRKKADEKAYAILEKNGIKLAFIGATFSLNQFSVPKNQARMLNHILLNDENCDFSILEEEAAEARAAGADIIILSLHMGPAYQAYPGSIAIRNMQKAVEATEAGLVIGTHPHHMQAFAVHRYKNRDGIQVEAPMFFSMGDFVACDIFKWGHACMIVKAEIEKGMIGERTFTRVSRIRIQPWYLKTGGKSRIDSLEFYPLYDFPLYRKNIENKIVAGEWEELIAFSDQFIFPNAEARKWLQKN